MHHPYIHTCTYMLVDGDDDDDDDDQNAERVQVDPLAAFIESYILKEHITTRFVSGTIKRSTYRPLWLTGSLL